VISSAELGVEIGMGSGRLQIVCRPVGGRGRRRVRMLARYARVGAVSSRAAGREVRDHLAQAADHPGAQVDLATVAGPAGRPIAHSVD
jgi:hypothetical protein